MIKSKLNNCIKLTLKFLPIERSNLLANISKLTERKTIVFFSLENRPRISKYKKKLNNHYNF